MPVDAPRLTTFLQVARRLAVIAVATAVTLGVADAQQRPRSQSDSRDPDARGATRQRVSPGQPPSSRREPSRLRNADEAPPTVQNRAPDLMPPRAEVPPAAGGPLPNAASPATGGQ